MGLIRLQGINKQLGEKVVLDNVTLDFHTGEKVGLVGANGTGKTTLFRIMAGDLTPDTGTVTLSKGLDIGYLPQEPVITEGQTLHDEVLSVFEEVLDLEKKLHAISEQMSVQPPGPELDELMTQYDRVNARFEAAGGYSFEQRLSEILGGLGFTTTDYSLPMSALSGGQKCRAALAKLLLQESQFLLLDEPTNHLDIDAVRWLEKFLAGHHGGAVIISHDRYLLDRVADRIVEIEKAHVHATPGNYTNYVKTKERRRLTQERQFEKDQTFIQKERTFIEKHIASQRGKEAKGRLTRLERRLKAGEFTLDKPSGHRKVTITFDEQEQTIQRGVDVLDVRELAKRYDGKTLFSDLFFTVPTEQRLGITGPNGTGKTTLLKIVLGHLAPDTGTYAFTAKAKVGYFAQETTELNPDHTIIDEIRTVRPDMLEAQARSFAARFLFRDEDPFKRIGQLSGGEQSRVRLMKIILQTPNVLVLDEPTNHLDIPSREVLEEALLQFSGTIIAVSHDRYFLDRICNRLLVMREDCQTFYNGNYTAYIEQIERERTEAEAPVTPQRNTGRPAHRDTALPAKPKKPSSRFARFSLEELEAFIMNHETRLLELQERFGDPKVYQDASNLARLREELETVKSELTEAEEEWHEWVDRS